MGLQGRSTLIGHQRKSVHFWELPCSLLFNYWDYWVHFLCISMYRYLLYMYVYIFICTEWNRERQSRVCGKCHTVTESGVMVFVYQSLLTRDVPSQLEVRSFARLFVPNLDLQSDEFWITVTSRIHKKVGQNSVPWNFTKLLSRQFVIKNQKCGWC